MARHLSLLAVLLLLTASTSYAQPPLLGTWVSDDVGGPVIHGHFSESWQSSKGGGDVGNTINMMSWDKMNLGAQWHIWCATAITPPVLIEDTVDSKGNGCRAWQTTYAGGYFWLAGDGPWGGGATEYNGLVDSYNGILRICYSDNKSTKTTCEFHLIGRFTDYPELCFVFDGECELRGNTERTKTVAENYPPLLEPNCQETGKYGGWGIVWNIGVTITGCTTPVEKSTWGAVKSRYAE